MCTVCGRLGVSTDVVCEFVTASDLVLQKRILKKIANCLLIVLFNRYGDNPNLCSNGNSCHSAKKKSNSMLAVYIAVPVVVLVVVGTLALLFFFMRGKKVVPPVHLQAIMSSNGTGSIVPP